MRDQALKRDSGKLQMELIPPSTLISLGKVLTYGADKYSPHSWKKVEKERYIGAILRHLVKYMEDNSSIDNESGLLHIEHVLANACFLNDMQFNWSD